MNVEEAMDHKNCPAEQSALSRTNTDAVSFADVFRCILIGLAAALIWCTMSFYPDRPYALVIIEDTKDSATATPRTPTPRQDFERASDHHHPELTLVERIQSRRTLRQKMYDHEATHQTLESNAGQRSFVIKPEHATLQTTITPAQLRSAMRAFHGMAPGPTSDSEKLSPEERVFAYKLRTEFGIGVLGQKRASGVHPIKLVTLKNALEDLVVIQAKRDKRLNSPAPSRVTHTTFDSILAEPKPRPHPQP
jgi:hypothetical protein